MGVLFVMTFEFFVILHRNRSRNITIYMILHANENEKMKKVVRMVVIMLIYLWDKLYAIQIQTQRSIAICRYLLGIMLHICQTAI